MDDLFLLGRVIFGGFFLYNGANHFLMNAMFVQYTAAKGVPMPKSPWSWRECCCSSVGFAS